MACDATLGWSYARASSTSLCAPPAPSEDSPCQCEMCQARRGRSGGRRDPGAAVPAAAERPLELDADEGPQAAEAAAADEIFPPRVWFRFLNQHYSDVTTSLIQSVTTSGPPILYLTSWRRRWCRGIFDPREKHGVTSSPTRLGWFRFLNQQVTFLYTGQSYFVLVATDHPTPPRLFKGGTLGGAWRTPQGRLMLSIVCVIPSFVRYQWIHATVPVPALPEKA